MDDEKILKDPESERCSEAGDVEDSGPTLIASQLLRLKQASFHAMTTRERLPQPLFWSLFHCEISDIRRRRLANRLAREAYLRGD